MKKTVSGIRGVFGDDLGLRDVLRFCDNFSSLVGPQARCVVGMDTRPSGAMVVEAAGAALMKNGIDVVSLGVAPTPAVFREARRHGAGLVVTSSHNPIEWNGIKFIIGGRGINERELSRIVDGPGPARPAGTIGTQRDISTGYVDEACGVIGRIRGRPEVAVDVGGGAAAGFAPDLLRRAGCSVSVINEDPAACSRGPDPTDDGLSELVRASATREIGFAFDLDGDRLVVVRDGAKQSPDLTLGLGVARALDLGHRSFVLSVDTSAAVEGLIRERGGSVLRSKVGEANVVQAMMESGARAGGEGSSGGFILPEFNYCRDGILTSGLIASMLGTATLDETAEYMARYHQVRTKVSAGRDSHGRIMEGLRSGLPEAYPGSETTLLDGIRCATGTDDDWVLVRRSNTEDVIRVSAESRDRRRCEEIAKDVAGIVAAAAG